MIKFYYPNWFLIATGRNTTHETFLFTKCRMASYMVTTITKN